MARGITSADCVTVLARVIAMVKSVLHAREMARSMVIVTVVIMDGLSAPSVVIVVLAQETFTDAKTEQFNHNHRRARRMSRKDEEIKLEDFPSCFRVGYRCRICGRFNIDGVYCERCENKQERDELKAQLAELRAANIPVIGFYREIRWRLPDHAQDVMDKYLGAVEKLLEQSDGS